MICCVLTPPNVLFQLLRCEPEQAETTTGILGTVFRYATHWNRLRLFLGTGRKNQRGQRSRCRLRNIVCLRAVLDGIPCLRFRFLNNPLRIGGGCDCWAARALQSGRSVEATL